LRSQKLQPCNLHSSTDVVDVTRTERDAAGDQRGDAARDIFRLTLATDRRQRAVLDACRLAFDHVGGHVGPDQAGPDLVDADTVFRKS
jgi:hypothetical protein